MAIKPSAAPRLPDGREIELWETITAPDGTAWEVVGWEAQYHKVRVNPVGDQSDIRLVEPEALGLSWKLPPQPTRHAPARPGSLLSAAGFILGLITWIVVFGGMALRSCASG